MSDGRYSQSVDQPGTMGDLSVVPSSISERGGGGVGEGKGAAFQLIRRLVKQTLVTEMRVHGRGNCWARCQSLLLAVSPSSLSLSRLLARSLSHTHISDTLTTPSV